MRAKDVEFVKEDIVLNFQDGTNITIDQEIAGKIWYAVEEKKIEEFIKELTEEDNYSEADLSDIKYMYICRAESFKTALKNHIAEEALNEFANSFESSVR